MKKTILLTGATDGIGLATAKALASQGHDLLLHGRNPEKLAAAEAVVSAVPGAAGVAGYLADLASMKAVALLAEAVICGHPSLDVVINNAGILKTPDPGTPDGLDIRFAVNTLAPYLRTKRLLPALGSAGRVVNLSSAAQAPVDLEAVRGQVRLDDMAAYAQSKIALTMWSRAVALQESGKVIVVVNPGSLLTSKMVQEGFGVAGGDIGIGADILTRAALSDEFATATGLYFENDAGRFGLPHLDALDGTKAAPLPQVMDSILADLSR